MLLQTRCSCQHVYRVYLARLRGHKMLAISPDSDGRRLYLFYSPVDAMPAEGLSAEEIANSLMRFAHLPRLLRYDPAEFCRTFYDLTVSEGLAAVRASLVEITDQIYERLACY